MKVWRWFCDRMKGKHLARADYHMDRAAMWLERRDAKSAATIKRLRKIAGDWIKGQRTLL